MLLSTELLSALCPYRALTAVGEITSSLVPKAAFVAIVAGMLMRQGPQQVTGIMIEPASFNPGFSGL